MVLEVNTDNEAYRRDLAEWSKYGCGLRRADTMHEAIKRLAGEETFILVIIDEDSVPDFTAQLPNMRDIANIPIFVYSSSYTIEKKVRAQHLGVDIYEIHNDSVKDNIIQTISNLAVLKRWANQTIKKLPILIGGDVILSVPRRTVFINDAEVDLQKKEFEILRRLMTYSGVYFTQAQLLRSVWGEEYVSNGRDLVWKAINRLRRKLNEASQGKDYIKVEREVGYKFSI